jgi:hypothetical protein
MTPTEGGANTAYITPGSPWENRFIESFNARLRDELLDREIMHPREAQIVIESGRRHSILFARMPKSITARRLRRCLCQDLPLAPHPTQN